MDKYDRIHTSDSFFFFEFSLYLFNYITKEVKANLFNWNLLIKNVFTNFAYVKISVGGAGAARSLQSIQIKLFNKLTKETKLESPRAPWRPPTIGNILI